MDGTQQNVTSSYLDQRDSIGWDQSKKPKTQIREKKKEVLRTFFFFKEKQIWFSYVCKATFI